MRPHRRQDRAYAIGQVFLNKTTRDKWVVTHDSFDHFKEEWCYKLIKSNVMPPQITPELTYTELNNKIKMREYKLI